MHNHLAANDDDLVIVSSFIEIVKSDIKRRFQLEAATIEKGYFILIIASFCDSRYNTLSFVTVSVKNTAIASVRGELNQTDQIPIINSNDAHATADAITMNHH